MSQGYKIRNFLITINEENRPCVKLIDFGFAHYIPEGESEKMHEQIGSFMYMAPEVLMKEPYDEKIDIWSVGIILYNMVTGADPFPPADNEIKRKEIINNEIKFNAINNEKLSALFRKMLERNPAKRIDAKHALDEAIKIKEKNCNQNY